MMSTLTESIQKDIEQLNLMPREVITNNDDQLDCVPADDVETVQPASNRVLLTEEDKGMSNAIESIQKDIDQLADMTLEEIMDKVNAENDLKDESMFKDDYDQYKEKELLDHYDIVSKRIDNISGVPYPSTTLEMNLSDANGVFENILSKDNSQRVMRAIENCFRSLP